MHVTQGTVHIHSSPTHLVADVERELSRALGQSVACSWSDQRLRRSCSRALVDWVAPIGSGPVIVSALQNLEELLFEVTEEQSRGLDGARWMYTPSCGVFYAPTDSAGNLVIAENRLNWILDSAKDYNEICLEIRSILGQPWDEELEPYRGSAPTPSVRLFRVG